MRKTKLSVAGLSKRCLNLAFQVLILLKMVLNFSNMPYLRHIGEKLCFYFKSIIYPSPDFD